MRWFVFVGVLLLTVVVGVGLFLRARQRQAQPPTSQLQTKVVVTIPVEGMVCLACTARVKSTLKAINGVTEVEVNLAGRVARVEYLEGKVSPEQLVAAINRLGYRAGPPRAEETK
jgi:copper chaperone CopZ